MLTAEDDDEEDEEDDDAEADDVVDVKVGVSNCRVPVSKRTNTNGTAGLVSLVDTTSADESEGGKGKGWGRREGKGLV